jgi:hypothetical protein
VQEAKAACARLRQLDPLLRINSLRDTIGSYQPDDLAKYQEALRKAEVPE